MIHAYADMLRGSFCFSGRTGRGPFWKAYLINLLISFLLLSIAIGMRRAYGMSETAVGAVTGIYMLMQWPVIPMYIRRMRDAELSQGMKLLLTLLVPGIGWLIVGCMKSRTDVPKNCRESMDEQIARYLADGTLQLIGENDYMRVYRMIGTYPVVMTYSDMLENAGQVMIRRLQTGGAGQKLPLDEHTVRMFEEMKAVRTKETGQEERMQTEEAIIGSLKQMNEQLSKARRGYRISLTVFWASIAIGPVSMTMLGTPDSMEKFMEGGLGLGMFAAVAVLFIASCAVGLKYKGSGGTRARWDSPA